MGFYSRLTPFQQGLVSVLMIAVPYFIAMVSIYVYFGLIASGSERCESLCCYHRMKLIESRLASTQSSDFINLTDHPEDYDILTSTITIPPVFTHDPNATKWLRHVLKGVTSFVVDGNTSIYSCPGALLNNLLVVTGGNCVLKVSNGQFQLDSKEIKIAAPSVERDGMMFYPINELSSTHIADGSASKVKKENNCSIIRFIGWNALSIQGNRIDKPFKLFSFGCPQKYIVPENKTCLVVTANNDTFNAVHNDIMVDCFAQLIGIYDKKRCQGNSCYVVFTDTRRLKDLD